MEQKKVTASERKVLKALVSGATLHHPMFYKKVYVHKDGRYQFSVSDLTVLILIRNGLITSADLVTEIGREAAIKGYYTPTEPAPVPVKNNE